MDFCDKKRYSPIKHQKILFLKQLVMNVFKGNAQFIFLCNPQKLSINVCLMKLLKSTVPKKVIVCFYNLGDFLNFLKLLTVTAFAKFPTSRMVLFEIHQRFKGHLLNVLRVSFKVPETKLFVRF